MPAQVALHQRDAGALHGDIRAGSHRDADAGFGQRRRIVDAVACHGHDAAFTAQLFHDGVLALRQNLGVHFDDAQSAGDGHGRGAVVTGEHHDANAIGPQAFKRGGGRGLDGIGDGDHAGRSAIDRDQHGGAALGSQALGLGFQCGGIDMQVLQQGRIPHGNGATIDLADDALAGNGLKLLRHTRRKPALARGGDDGARQRMFAAVLERSGAAQHLCLVESGGCHYRNHPGRPSVSVPVLSTTSVSTFSMCSSASALRMSTPAPAPLPTPTMIDMGVARPSAHGQAMISTDTALTSANESARRRSEHHPGDETDRRNGDDGRHEPGRHQVGQALDGCAAALGFDNHVHDAREHHVGADPLGAHDQGAGAVDRAADQFLAGLLGYRQ